MLPDKAVVEWKNLMKKHTGKKISVLQARERANRTFNFLKLITKPNQEYKIPSQETGKNKTEKLPN